MGEARPGAVAACLVATDSQPVLYSSGSAEAMTPYLASPHRNSVPGFTGKTRSKRLISRVFRRQARTELLVLKHPSQPCLRGRRFFGFRFSELYADYQSACACRTEEDR